MRFSFPTRIRIRQALILIALAGALICMFPPAHPVFAWWSGHARFVALGYLVLGLLCLVANRVRLMFICFGCSAAISFYYNETSGREKQSPQPPIQSDQRSGATSRHFFPAENQTRYELASPCQ